jgi:hypothetical protein
LHNLIRIIDRHDKIGDYDVLFNTREVLQRAPVISLAVQMSPSRARRKVATQR